MARENFSRKPRPSDNPLTKNPTLSDLWLNPGLHHHWHANESSYYTLNTHTHNQVPTGTVDKSQVCKSIQFTFA
jgi:hypothetical protein